MKIAIRADSSFEIGTGHVMRCLTLADELQKHDCRVWFFSRELSGNVISIIRSSGHEIITLPNSTDNGPNDALQTIQALNVLGSPPDWLVVDHHEIGREWEQAARPYVARIMAIDDLSNRSHDCDLLLDQNYFVPGTKFYERLVPSGTRVLLGPQYVLLRPEFREWRNLSSVRRQVDRILISFGGSDPANATVMTLHAFLALQWPSAIDVVVGSANQNLNEIQKLCRQLPLATLHLQTPHMAELMSKSDLAIGGAGTTTWERCCLGLPSVIISIADNQVRVAEAIQYAQAGWYLGAANSVTSISICQIIQRIADNAEEIEKSSRRAFDLVDGEGASRVVDIMLTQANHASNRD